MKLNANGGYDQETTLEFFNSHIPDPDYVYCANVNFHGLYWLNSIGRDDNGTIVEHADTYLNEDKSSWRVQLRIKFFKGKSMESKWSYISSLLRYYGRLQATDKKTGELIWIEPNNNGINIIFTFCLPYIESMPEFSTPKERREWYKAIFKKE